MSYPNVKTIGADRAITNLSGGHWADTVQVSAVKTRVYKISYTNLSGGDVWLWVFNLAAGSGSSASPDMVRWCPSGLSDTWDFDTDGALFTNGVYIAISQVRPTDPTTTPTAAGNDAAIVRAEIRAV